MIEQARIVTRAKIKASLSTTKDNINFWNNLHQLGLTGFHEKTNAAVWTIANCVIAMREMGADLTEILLMVAQRQSNYQWAVGLYPEEQVQGCWNRLFRLFQGETRSDAYQLVEPAYRRVSWEIELLARSETLLPRHVLIARVEQRLQGKYKEADRKLHFAEEMEKLQRESDCTKAFKREQDALQDLTPDQLAGDFLKMILPSKQTTVRSNEQSAAMDVQEGDGTQHVQETEQAEQWRRGGPIPTPNEEKERVVKEWLLAQGKETQESFCNRKGIGTSTLRAWIRELRAKDKLSPS